MGNEQHLSLLFPLVLTPVCRQQESPTGIFEVCLSQCHSLARAHTGAFLPAGCQSACATVSQDWHVQWLWLES